mmetsp:Transcript_53854/g.173933  ORF Transcript_53854/g.173933 Transcript_53854/m.173933 type:complete len:235 (-) Transcript_53854:324-1028(-)
MCGFGQRLLCQLTKRLHLLLHVSRLDGPAQLRQHAAVGGGHKGLLQLVAKRVHILLDGRPCRLTPRAESRSGGGCGSGCGGRRRRRRSRSHGSGTPRADAGQQRPAGVWEPGDGLGHRRGRAGCRGALVGRRVLEFRCQQGLLRALDLRHRRCHRSHQVLKLLVVRIVTLSSSIEVGCGRACLHKSVSTRVRLRMHVVLASRGVVGVGLRSDRAWTAPAAAGGRALEAAAAAGM